MNLLTVITEDLMEMLYQNISKFLRKYLQIDYQNLEIPLPSHLLFFFKKKAIPKDLFLLYSLVNQPIFKI